MSSTMSPSVGTRKQMSDSDKLNIVMVDASADYSQQ